MKTLLVRFFAAVLFSSSARAGSVLLSDDFSGQSLDSSKWNTILPFSGSSVTQTNGEVLTQNRGVLTTRDEFFGPFEIAGSFTMLSSFEHLKIAFRSDLTGSDYGERPGMFVAFSNDGDQISIQRYTNQFDTAILAVKDFALFTGQTYNFKIFDDGTNVDFSVDGVHQLSASSSFTTGNHIAFYSREFGAGSRLDNLSVTSVPEFGSVSLYFSIGLLGLVFIRRRTSS